MKTNAKVNANSKQTAAQAVKVSAAVKAAVAAILASDAKYAAVSAERSSKWEACGKALAKEFKTADEARPVLKQAYKDAGQDPQNMTIAGYISRILSLGFPANPDMVKKAEADKLGMAQKMQVCAGTLTKKGNKWVKIEKPTKSGNRAKKSGGHNRKKPFDTFDAALALAFTGADKAQLDFDQVATALFNATKDTRFAPKGNREKLLEAITEKFAD